MKLRLLLLHFSVIAIDYLEESAEQMAHMYSVKGDFDNRDAFVNILMSR